MRLLLNLVALEARKIVAGPSAWMIAEAQHSGCMYFVESQFARVNSTCLYSTSFLLCFACLMHALQLVSLSVQGVNGGAYS
jgi:hypothetical protein